MNKRIDPHWVLQQIDQLYAMYPDLWEEPNEQLLADSLAGQTDLNEALTQIVNRIHDDEDRLDTIKIRIGKQRERHERIDRRVTAMRDLAFKLMQHANVPKIELALATLSVRAGTPKVVITDETALPESCIRTKREPDRVAIKDFLTSGVSVPGASLSNAEPGLTIKDR